MPTFPTDNPALQAQLNTQVDLFTQMSRHAVDAAGQIGELNLRMMRQMFDDSIRYGRALAACKDPFQMGAVAMRETQPTVEHLRAWQGELMKVLGAGTAALAGYLRDIDWPHGGQIDVVQGEDMGMRSRLRASFDAAPGGSIRVSGTARPL